MKPPLSQEDKEFYKQRILVELTKNHIGAEKAIGMGELHELVFKETWHHRINDTRLLRRLITELRWDGVPICSVSSKDGGGYYLASVGSELKKFLDKLHRRALKILKIEAKIEGVSMLEKLGQMSLNLREGSDDAA